MRRTRIPKATAPLTALIAGLLLLAPARPAAAAAHTTFTRGDLFVSLRTGVVQWYSPDGTPNGTLINVVPGKAEGMGVDALGHLYVSHYCADASFCLAGNSVERFNSNGVSLGAFGGGYNCNPYSFAFDRTGRVFVGEADCTGDLLVLDGSGALRGAFDVGQDGRGAARMDLAPDGCTMFYTSQGPNVKRYDVCSGRQLPDFNAAPIPGGVAHALRILPDGGVLVAAVYTIVRLNSAGAVVQSYDVAGAPDLWMGLDLAGDGTFWASNYGSSDIVRFDMATGTVLSSFNTGTPTTTVKDVLVMR